MPGAQGFSYWLFRQQRSGAEISHGSILSAWGKPTMGYDDVMEASRVKELIEPYVLNSRIAKGQIALMYSDLARITLETEPMEFEHYWKLIQEVYESEIPSDIQVDIVNETSDLNGYDLLYTPFMASVTDEFLVKAMEYVDHGGIWIAGPMCNYRTSEHTVPTDGGWGKLTAYGGVEVEYMVDFTSADIIGTALGKKIHLTMLGTTFESKDAKSLGTISSENLKDKIFLTESSVGQGKLVLLGAHPAGQEGDLFMKDLIISYLNEQSGLPVYRSEKGIRAIKRLGMDGTVYLCGVDMEGKGGMLYIDVPYDIRVGEACEGNARRDGIMLKPYETVVAVIKNPTKPFPHLKQKIM